MSVRGLPKGTFTSGLDGYPEWGTVEYVDGANSGGYNDDPTVSSMAANEFTIITAGVSGNGYMYNIGYNESDLECTMLGKHHVATWVALELALVRPYPSTALTHNTSVNLVYGDTNSPGWVRDRFRIPSGSGFRGVSVSYERQHVQATPDDQFTLTPPTNPMSNPGGLCFIGAYKEDDAGYWPFKLVSTGSEWNLGSYGYFAISAYCILPTDQIYTPGSLTFGSDSDLGNAIWAGLVVYLR